ncbi:MAG: PadR family transcriptional regulator [Thermoleophilia bacterium]
MLSIADESVHGYELVDRATFLVGHMVAVDKGSVYRLLRDFERKGLLTSNWEEQPSGPSRRVYHLTAGGARCLASITRGLVDRANCLLELAREAEDRLVYAPPQDASPPEAAGSKPDAD